MIEVADATRSDVAVKVEAEELELVLDEEPEVEPDVVVAGTLELELVIIEELDVVLVLAVD